jgi:glycosyltransferase involved in cell wall biosynthesis
VVFLKNSNALTIGIDASRNRSGGAKAHLIGILSECAPEKHRICAIHVWAFRALLDQLPDYPWLFKHNPIALEQSLIKQLGWQATALAAEVKSAGCDILFTTDASTLCRFSPMVVLSQDLLSYEPGMMRYYGYGLARLRLLAILVLQNLTFRRAAGVIFLTHYAEKVIQQSCGRLPSTICIPHGVDAAFKKAQLANTWPEAEERPIRCIYVSNAEKYKYQWVVVKAIAALRQRGHNVSLTLVGGGKGAAQKLVEDTIANLDPIGMFVKQFDFLPKDELPTHLAQSDLFIFASGCETFGITLLEGMAFGMPIACSNRSSLPETLQNGGIYFDPEDADSISVAVEQIIQSPALRLNIARLVAETYLKIKT